MLLLAYLMRLPLLSQISAEAVALLGVALAAVLARYSWDAPGIFRINQVLILLSIVSVVQGGLSVAQSLSAPNEPLEEVVVVGGTSPTFVHKPNVYYLIADAYPSAESLSRVHDLDSNIYRELEKRSFTIYPSAFSNYMATLSSLLATFGMDHHFYRGRIGNLEILRARELIAGKSNPVVKIFQDNGYRVVYAQQTGHLFTQGCFVSECMPQFAMTQLAELLLPDKLKSLRNRLTGQTLEAFEERARGEFERISRQETPQFTYLHMHRPNHSSTSKQNAAGLASFRADFPKRLEDANAIILDLVDAIVARDSNALIVVGADHGAWSLGSYGWADDAVFEAVDPSLIALDHLGILLAIRWPGAAPTFEPELRTSVNLFRHLFAYLAETPALLANAAADDGYLMRGRGEKSGVFRVVEDGRLMTNFVELPDSN